MCPKAPIHMLILNVKCKGNKKADTTDKERCQLTYFKFLYFAISYFYCTFAPEK